MVSWHFVLLGAAAVLQCHGAAQEDSQLADPCVGFMHTSKDASQSNQTAYEQCVLRYRLYVTGGLRESDQKPFWLMLVLLIVKSTISRQLFGPDRVADGSGVRQSGAKAKAAKGFQLALLILFVCSLVNDILAIQGFLAVDDGFGRYWGLLQLSLSGNLSSGALYMGLRRVKIHHVLWPFLHTDDPEVEDPQAHEAKLQESQGQSFVVSAYLLGSCTLAWGPMMVVFAVVFAVATLLYPWVWVCAFVALHGGLSVCMVELMVQAPPAGSSPLLGGQAPDAERQRLILEKLGCIRAGEFPDDEAGIEARYWQERRAFEQTGSTRTAWVHYYRYQVRTLVWAVFISLGLKLFVVLEVYSPLELVTKLVCPIFAGGEAWEVLRGAYLPVVWNTFCERDTNLYTWSVAQELAPKLQLLNSLL